MDTLQQITRFNLQKKINRQVKTKRNFSMRNYPIFKERKLDANISWKQCMYTTTYAWINLYIWVKENEWNNRLTGYSRLILLVCYFKFKKKIFIQWFPHYKTYPEQWPNVNLKACSSILLCIFNSIFNLFSVTFNENLHTNGINIFVWWVPSQIIF